MMKPMLHVSPHRQRRPSVHVSHTHQPLVEALRCYYRRPSSSPRLALLVTSLSSFSLMLVALVVRPHLPALAAALLALALLLVLLVTTLLARQALANRVTRAKTIK